MGDKKFKQNIKLPFLEGRDVLKINQWSSNKIKAST